MLRSLEFYCNSGCSLNSHRKAYVAALPAICSFHELGSMVRYSHLLASQVIAAKTQYCPLSKTVPDHAELNNLDLPFLKGGEPVSLKEKLKDSKACLSRL